MRWVPAPSLEDFDGIACGAVGDFIVCEPYTWVATEIAEASYAVFYPLGINTPAVPVDPEDPTQPGILPPRYMVVYADDRGMSVYGDC